MDIQFFRHNIEQKWRELESPQPYDLVAIILYRSLVHSFSRELRNKKLSSAFPPITNENALANGAYKNGALYDALRDVRYSPIYFYFTDEEKDGINCICTQLRRGARYGTVNF